MNRPTFLQIHYLTSFPASLINRDDVGLAKRIPFGGVSRIRISSQCLKRHWRTAEGDYALRNLGLSMSIRSRLIFDQEIGQKLLADGYPNDAVKRVLSIFMANILGESPKKKKEADSGVGKNKDADSDFETKQLIVLGRPEVDYILTLAKNIFQSAKSPVEAEKAAEALFSKDKEQKQNLDALRNAGSGLDAALFGRMVTSDILSRGDAAVHVAHAFTVHKEETESDYFTAVDDLLPQTGELGSAHINETELTSGLFYGYMVVDIAQLISNLQGIDRTKDQTAWLTADGETTAKVIAALIHLVATVSPGAKKGSTAPYSYAQLLLAEVGTRQPRTLANAFLKPVPLEGDIMSTAVKALGSFLTDFDRMYGKKEDRRVSSMSGVSCIPADSAVSVDELVDWAAQQARGIK
jgi:CRISPR system Cascade subunit CasC